MATVSRQGNKLANLLRLLSPGLGEHNATEQLSMFRGGSFAILSFTAFILGAFVFQGTAAACTGISLKTTDGRSVHARTIEWASGPLGSELVVAPRNLSFISHLPKEKNGITWSNRYGYVGISLIEARIVGEGINEAGLNAGLFYFPGYGSLAPFDPKNTKNSIADIDLVRWILGRCATVDDVREALAKVTVAPAHLDEDGRPSPTAHWRVTDAKGGNIVIEIIDEGNVHVYDNEVGLITNSPGFPWHVTHLNTLINVQPGTLPPRKLGDHPIFSFGAGTAALGLPGDYSPSSRFVRAAFYRNSAPPMETPLEAVSQAFHILSNFDIPIGTAFAPEHRDDIPDMPSATHWTAVSDPTDLKFYYRTMHDGRVKCVDLERIDFTAEKVKTYSIDSGRFTFDDATPQ
ncbi:MAG TPA: choloylglycine hydrolase family protein [candidate division Zixibacteria bacterium]|nr:choloylglycine hydrolase family protein [candidate division Zixibacteria bacterium]